MNVQTLYKIFTGAENRVAGGEGIVGVYGSLAGSSMHRIFSTMKMYGHMDDTSVFLDVGAGLGRPLLHAFYVEGVTNVRGIEIDAVKCIKANAFADRVGMILHERNIIPIPPAKPLDIWCEAVESLQTLDPVTHVYSFWEGFAYDVREKIATLCRDSVTVRTVAIVQRAVRDHTDILGDGFSLVACFPVTMSGSRRRFSAYIFSKDAC